MKTLNILMYKPIIFLLLLVSIACKKEKLTIDTIKFTGNEVVLSSDADTMLVSIEPSGPWRIKYATSNWFKTDILGGPKSQKSFKIIHQKNDQDNMRTAEIIVYAENGSFQDTITILQLSKYPTILIAKNTLEISSKVANYAVNFETNIPETSIELETSYKDGAINWVKNILLSDGVVYFDVEKNIEVIPRVAEIKLSFKDDYDRTVSEIITITQSQHADIDNAELRTITSIQSLPQGIIGENIFISGHIVSNGVSTNYKSNRYILQDENNRAICFESNGNLVFNEFDKVELWLKDVQVNKNSEGLFSYNVLTNITPLHIITSTASTFVPKEVAISAINDDYLFALVALKDVEISSPYGAFTNFKKSISTGNPSPNFMAKFPSYYLFYPTSIRDIHGDNMYMLTNPSADFALQAVPQGSGTITGIIVREKLTNFDIKESQYSIRPLKRAAINLQTSRSSSFTNVLVEWDCNRPSNLSTAAPETFIAPNIGSSTAVLYKTNTDGFFGSRKTNNTITFQDEFRGNAGNDGRVAGVNGSAYNSLAWSINDYWYIDKVSTKGIQSLLSIQIEANSGWSGGPTDMALEYAFDLNGPWIKIPDSDFKSLGQFDRTAALGQTINNIPGYKVYDFKLPSALNDKENICIRIKPTTSIGTNNTTSLSNTHRLANVSIKYNK